MKEFLKWAGRWLLLIAIMGAIIYGALILIKNFFPDDNMKYVFITFMIVTPVGLGIAHEATDDDIYLHLLYAGGIAVVAMVVSAAVIRFYSDFHDVYDEKPESVNYHTAEDLRRATLVDFPEVVAVDSLYHYEFMWHYTEVRFVPRDSLGADFYKKLDEACQRDSDCWSKSDGNDGNTPGYYYRFLPDRRPIDRTRGTKWRLVENGDKKPCKDWDGDYMSVFVPLKGDTIIVQDGWRN